MGNPDRIISKKCLLPLRKQALKIQYIVLSNILMRMKYFLRKLSLTNSAGFLTYRSTHNPTISAIYQWFHWILLPGYSDRIVQDFHLIPSQSVLKNIPTICTLQQTDMSGTENGFIQFTSLQQTVMSKSIDLQGYCLYLLYPTSSVRRSVPFSSQTLRQVLQVFGSECSVVISTVLLSVWVP